MVGDATRFLPDSIYIPVQPLPYWKTMISLTASCTCWLAVYHYQICSIIRWYDWLLVSQPGRMLSVCSCKCETITLSHKQFSSWHWWSVCCCYILLLFYQPSLLEIIKPWVYLFDIKLNNRLEFLPPYIMCLIPSVFYGAKYFLYFQIKSLRVNEWF